MRATGALAAVGILTLAWAAQLAYWIPRLPEHIASHFGARGQPNAWMSHGGYVAFQTALLAFLALVLVGSGWLAGAAPRLANVPNRDYWFAPERRQQTRDVLLRYLLWLLAGILAFIIAVNQVVFAANRSGTGLSTTDFLLVLGIALVGELVWLVRLLLAFRRP